MRIDIEVLLDKIGTCSVNEKISLIKGLRNSPDYNVQEKKKLYDRLSSDSSYFARVCFGHIVHEIPLFHREIYSAFDDENLTYLGIVVFRQAAKSTLKVIKVCQLACNQKTKYTLLISETEDQAFDDLRTLKDEFETNEVIQLLYFNDKTAEGEIWANGTIVLINGVCIKAKGMNSRMRGMKYKFQRPDHIMLDDFESEDNSHSDEARADVSNKISAVIIPIGDVITRFIFFNTLPNDQCFMATEIANPNGIFAAANKGKFIKYQITQIVNGVEEPTWLLRYPWEWIRAKKNYYIARKELHIWLQEFFNIPGNRSEPKMDANLVTMVKAKFVNAGAIKYLEYKDGTKVVLNTFIGVDPASTTNKKSDNTIVFTIGITPSEDIVILSVKVRKISITKQPMEVFNTMREYYADNTTIESISYQLSLYEYVEKAMYDMNEYFTITPYKKTLSKDNKFIAGLEPLINGGKVSYVEGCEGIEVFPNEVTCYSGGIKEHDDTLDGLYLALFGYWVPGQVDVDEYLEAYSSMKRLEEKEEAGYESYENSGRNNYTYDWTTA